MNRADSRPNVIVVLTDQQRWDTTGAGGNPLGLTPHFDRMAHHGTHAALAFSPQPVCAPARAALQTGRYPTDSGVHRNGIRLPHNTTTLATEFGDAGYATGYIGKWHLADSEPVPPGQRGGYQSWLGTNLLEFTSDAYRTIMFDHNGHAALLPGYRSDACFDAAIRYVTEHHAEPFFLFLSLMEPHHQNEVDSYPAPTGYAERYAGRWMPPDLATLSANGGTAHRHMGGYLGQIARVDEGLGRLHDALLSLDLSDDTIVAFTSDHGCHFRTRNEEYKRSCHDGSIRVPLAISGPGFDSGGRIGRPVSTVDLPVTLLDAAGIAPSAPTHGHSLLPLLRDAGAEFPEEALIQISESQCGRAIRTERWMYCVADPDADAWDDPFGERYVETELYDLRHDPYEMDNLVGLETHRDVADSLRQRLLRRLRGIGEDGARIDRARRRPSRPQREVDPRVHRLAADPIDFGGRRGRD